MENQPIANQKKSTTSSAYISLDPEILEAIYTSKDQDLKSLSEQKLVMLVFLRHFGCSFCREAMTDLSKIREELEQSFVELVMVHMAEEELAQNYFDKYGLADVAHISDPDLSLYEYFGLHRGSFWQLYGLKTWLRGISVGYFAGMGLTIDEKKLGNTSQMPGIFILKNGQILNQFIHKSAADHPDYKKIINTNK